MGGRGKRWPFVYPEEAVAWEIMVVSGGSEGCVVRLLRLLSNPNLLKISDVDGGDGGDGDDIPAKYE